MSETLTCLLCGTTSHDVIHTWARWKEPVDGKTFTMTYRCRDRVACAGRVEANGDPWPVVDGKAA